ncbi:MAG: PIN domain-containing protein [Propionibacteriaceae bacterium]|nr:PIN domain-containing protein [Propionibacteriaceae bacterium]
MALFDTIWRCAERGLFRPKWSQQVLEEVLQVVPKVHPELPPSRVYYRLDQMRRAFEESIVCGYGPMISGISLPDPHDRHIVAAAQVGRADLIVTDNLSHFPSEELEKFGLEAVGPDCFLQDMLDLAPEIIRSIILIQALDAQRPSQQEEDVLVALERAGVGGFVHDYRTLFSVT